ncbi:MAG TPA: cation diffusion facilitator family transporter [Candidatus Limnocylindrales bacterium]|nr:cation diffusion facilitator family transporter [Candidatus Limnocylindrales bacterium]
MESVSPAARVGAASKTQAALVSVLVNAVLIAAKLVVGLLSGSVAILADAAHSFLDLSASIFALVGIRAAEKPPDEDHAFGHGKAENVSSLVQMFLLGATCIAIVIESVRRLVVISSVHVAWYSFAVVIGAVVIDIVVSRYLGDVSKAHGGSAALEADALHFTSDLWASLAVLAGITVVAVFGLNVADPLAGILVAVIIGTTAVSAGRKTAQILLDAMPDAATISAIERILASDPRLHGYHALRARQSGKHVLLDVAVHVDGSLSLAQAHEVGHAVSERIRREVPVVSDAVVHVEPADDEAHG